MTPETERLINYMERYMVPEAESVKGLIAAIRAESKPPQRNPHDLDPHNFGEPWRAATGAFLNRDGNMVFASYLSASEYTDLMGRVCACVNALRVVRNPAAVKDHLDFLADLIEKGKGQYLFDVTALWARFNEEPPRD